MYSRDKSHIRAINRSAVIRCYDPELMDPMHQIRALRARNTWNFAVKMTVKRVPNGIYAINPSPSLGTDAIIVKQRTFADESVLRL